MPIIVPAAAGDQNPTNRGNCPTHGTYTGLICTQCVVTLPPRLKVRSGAAA